MLDSRAFFDSEASLRVHDDPILSAYVKAIQHDDKPALHAALRGLQRGVLQAIDMPGDEGQARREELALVLVAALHSIIHPSSDPSQREFVPAVDALLARRLASLAGQLGAELGEEDLDHLERCLQDGQHDSSFPAPRSDDAAQTTPTRGRHGRAYPALSNSDIEFIKGLTHLAKEEFGGRLERIEEVAELLRLTERRTGYKPPPLAYERCLQLLLAPARLSPGETVSPAVRTEAELLLLDLQRRGMPLPLGAWADVLRAHRDAFIPDLEAAQRVYDLARRASAQTTMARGKAYDAPLCMLEICVRTRRVREAVQVLAKLADSREILLGEHILPYCEKLVRLSTSSAEIVAAIKHTAAIYERSALSDKPEDWQMPLLHQALEVRIRNEERREVVGVSVEDLASVFRSLSTIGGLPTARQYTMLLQSLVVRVPQANPAERAVLREHVSSLHQVMKADMDLDPDIAVLNTLMNAYNLLGDWQIALDIWHSLQAGQAPIDASTMAIVFDVCGWHKQLDTARQALSWAQTVERRLARARGGQGAIMNPHAWAAYHECLCRCYRLRESMHLAFDRIAASDEGQQQPLTTSDEIDLFTLLLKFAARERDRGRLPAEIGEKLRKRIRRERPEAVWEAVKHVGQGGGERARRRQETE